MATRGPAVSAEFGDGKVPRSGAEEADLEPGQEVGEYVIDCKLGEGGFGQVFKATHPLIGKEVAVKVLSRQYCSQPEMVSRFVSEARAVNQIRHRNIIDIFSFGQLEDGRRYYVMEYLPGQPLDRYLAEVGRIPLHQTVSLLRGIATALDAAHEAGIVHRDLKPENVFLVDEDGALSPRLLDFGVAKLLVDESSRQHRTRTGAAIGTAYYMSPEQSRGRNVDHRTDVYALGVVAFEMLTGEKPFCGDGYVDVLIKQIQDEPPLPSTRVSGISASVDRVIGWMLAKDPDDRPQTAGAAAEALAAAAVGAHADIVLTTLPDMDPVAVGRSRLRSRSASQKAETFASGSAGGAAGAGNALSWREDLGTAQTMAAAAALSQEGRDNRPKSRALTWIGTLAGAAAIGGIVLFVFSSLGGGSGASHGVRADPAKQTPAAGAGPGSAAALTPGVPASRSVCLHVLGAPKGTRVFGPDGTRLGKAPGEIHLPRGTAPIKLTLRAHGYQKKVVTVTPDKNQPFPVKMTPKPKPRHVRRRNKRVHRSRHHRPPAGEEKDSIADPFAK